MQHLSIIKRFVNSYLSNEASSITEGEIKGIYLTKIERKNE
jgi:hypothetical protein